METKSLRTRIVALGKKHIILENMTIYLAWEPTWLSYLDIQFDLDSSMKLIWTIIERRLKKSCCPLHNVLTLPGCVPSNQPDGRLLNVGEATRQHEFIFSCQQDAHGVISYDATGWHMIFDLRIY